MSLGLGSLCALAALACLYFGLRRERSVAWLAAAGASLGLASTAQPVFAAGALALLLPLRWGWWRGRAGGRGLAAVALAFMAVTAIGWVRWPPGFSGWELQSGRFWRNFGAAYLAWPHWSPYFPFIEPARLVGGSPSAPALPGGLLVLLPLGWLAAAVPLLARRSAPAAPGLRRFANATAVFHVGLAVACLGWQSPSSLHGVVLGPTLLILAGLGWVGAWSAIRSGTARRLFGAVGGALAAWSGLAGLLLLSQPHGPLRAAFPGAYRFIAHACDQPASLAERIAGARFGPLDILLEFPPGGNRSLQPLVATGWGPFSDRLSVRCLDGGRIEFGSEHGTAPWGWSPPLPVGRAGVHRVHVEMGSLFPPREAPFFDRFAAAEGDLMASRLRVVVDGQVAFDRSRRFYDASPGTLLVGRERSEPGGVGFAGRIFGWARGAWNAPIAQLAVLGPIRLTVRLPLQPPGGGLPLISVGARGRGGVLFVRFTAPRRIRLGYDQWGVGLVQSADMEIDPIPVHSFGVRLPALQPPNGPPEEEAVRSSLLVEFDGRPVWTARLAASPSGRVLFGRNGIGATSCRMEFPGGVIRGEPFDPAGLEAPKAPDEVEFELQWPRGRVGRREPLVVAGRAGSADLISVEYLAGDRIRFSFDHWGKFIEESPPLAADYDHLHRLEIVLPGLAPPSGRAEFPGRLEVALDGRSVWQSDALFYRTDAGSLALGEDRIGGSSDPEFTGGVAQVALGARPPGD